MLDHKHLIVRAEVTHPPSDPAFIKEWVKEIIHSIGMKLAVGPEANPISYYCNLEGNTGLTCVAILETSHCAIHVWDDVSPAIVQFDLYTCSELDPAHIFPFLEPFGIVSLDYTFIDRKDQVRILATHNETTQ